MLDMAFQYHLVVSVFNSAGGCAIIVEFCSIFVYLSV